MSTNPAHLNCHCDFCTDAESSHLNLELVSEQLKRARESEAAALDILERSLKTGGRYTSKGEWCPEISPDDRNVAYALLTKAGRR